MLYDKKNLYRDIDAKIKEFGGNFDALNLDYLLNLCNIELKYCKFKCKEIGAVLLKGDPKSGIMVNEDKSFCDQRFDIAHELIHFWFHSTITSLGIDIPIKRNNTLEWQANEGAAQLLLPYMDFIPRFLSVAAYVEENYEPTETIYTELAAYYNVNPVVVNYRIQNLDNEILECARGVPIDKISLLTTKKTFNKNKRICVNKKLIDSIRRNNLL